MRTVLVNELNCAISESLEKISKSSSARGRDLAGDAEDAAHLLDSVVIAGRVAGLHEDRQAAQSAAEPVERGGDRERPRNCPARRRRRRPWARARRRRCN